MLVYRLHHAVTDGQGSIRALLSVTSLDEDLTKKQYSAGYVGRYTNSTRHRSDVQWRVLVTYMPLDALRSCGAGTILASPHMSCT